VANSRKLMWALACTLVLSGCSKPLDFRNAEIAHGKIYSAGANSGFSGKVTNIPFDKLPADRVYKFTTVISKILTDSFHAYSPVYGGERGAFCDTNVSDGLVDGETSCRIAESGFPVFQFSFRSGQLDGALIVFDLKKNGTKVATAHFANGQLDGASEIYSPNNGKTVHKAAWKDGLANGVEEVFDENTGNLTFSGTTVKGLYDGETSRFSADGKLIEKQSWRNGVLQQASQSSAATENGATIKIVGKTADGKYPIYELEGDVNALSYFSPGLVWTPNDLLTRLAYLEPADVDHGYTCDWVCKDSANHIVGLNPGRKISQK
jgi:hypothetical protein